MTRALPILGVMVAALFQPLDAAAQANLVAATSQRHGMVSIEDRAEWADWSSTSTGLICWITFAAPAIAPSNLWWDASKIIDDAWQTNSAAVPAWTSTASGSVRLDGTNDHLRVSGLNFTTGDFTIAAAIWCERTSSTHAVASRIGGGNTHGWIFSNARFGIQNGTTFLFTAAGTFPTSNWLVVFGGRSTTQVFFSVTNGAIATAATNAIWNINQPTNAAAIGCRYQGASPDLFFPGSVGEVMAWNRALTSNEMAAVFAATRGRYGI